MTAGQRKKPRRIPKLRFHKATGKGYAVIDGRTIYFGTYGEDSTEQNYHRYIAEWLAGEKEADTPQNEITIAEVIAYYWQHVKRYYVRADGSATHEQNNIRQAMRPLRELYGCTHAVDFGPRALKTVRQEMVARGWCRTNINKMVGRIKRMFRWAAEQEMLPGSIYQNLRTVPGLKRGRSEAKESKPVKPVNSEYVNAIKPYVSQQVWAMVQLQQLTGARSGEIVIIRPMDIDTSGKVWTYIPATHKTAHQGKERVIFFGPKAQAVLRPWLVNRARDEYLFSPAEAEVERRRESSLNRKTRQCWGNRPGTNIKLHPQRKAGQHYTTVSYGKSIAKAIKKAYRPEGMSDQEFRTWKPKEHWHPHQLRHNAATYLRKEFGLEAARIILGHTSPVVTEIYAEIDHEKAVEVIGKVG